LILIWLDFAICSAEVGGVTKKLDSGGGGGRWLIEEEK